MSGGANRRYACMNLLPTTPYYDRLYMDLEYEGDLAMGGVWGKKMFTLYSVQEVRRSSVLYSYFE